MPVNAAACTLSIGQRLAEERQRIAMTQEAMGQFLNVSNITQCQYEKGYGLPGAQYLIGAQDLGVDVFYVLVGRRTSIEWRVADATEGPSRQFSNEYGSDVQETRSLKISAEDQFLLRRFPELGSRNRDLFLQLLAELLRRG